MQNIIDGIFYTESHEWLKLIEEHTVQLGVTHHAQDLLGDIIYIPEPDLTEFKAGDVITTIETVKSVAEVYTPIECTLIRFNENISSNPESINSNPYDSWIVELKIKNKDALLQLLDSTAYKKIITAEQ